MPAPMTRASKSWGSRCSMILQDRAPPASGQLAPIARRNVDASPTGTAFAVEPGHGWASKTGEASMRRRNVSNGYITAASYLNDVLGGVEIAGEKYKIELKLFDDASDPARATTLIQRQIDEGTDFFLGSFG